MATRGSGIVPVITNDLVTSDFVLPEEVDIDGEKTLHMQAQFWMVIIVI